MPKGVKTAEPKHSLASTAWCSARTPPVIICWESGEWWLADDARPWQSAGANVLRGKLVFRARLIA
jgi:hypothetical protein